MLVGIDPRAPSRRMGHGDGDVQSKIRLSVEACARPSARLPLRIGGGGAPEAVRLALSASPQLPARALETLGAPRAAPPVRRKPQAGPRPRGARFGRDEATEGFSAAAALGARRSSRRDGAISRPEGAR